MLVLWSKTAPPPPSRKWAPLEHWNPLVVLWWPRLPYQLGDPGSILCQTSTQMDLIIPPNFSGLHNRKQPWNPYSAKPSEKTASPKDNIPSGDLNVPRNSHEFQKYWRKCQKDKVKKYQYLITIGGPTLAEIFQAEISMGLLGEIVDIFNENWKADDFSKIYNILHGLATVKRFSLSLQFLSGREKKVLIELFQKLNEVIVERQSGDCVHVDCLRTLEKSYGVTVE